MSAAATIFLPGNDQKPGVIGLSVSGACANTGVKKMAPRNSATEQPQNNLIITRPRCRRGYGAHWRDNRAPIVEFRRCAEPREETCSPWARALVALAGMDPSGQAALIDIGANFLKMTLVPVCQGR
jgi:hypothetical protein